MRLILAPVLEGNKIYGEGRSIIFEAMDVLKTNKKIIAKPFLKWAGGKTQLLSTINSFLPKEILNEPFTYIEPFVGSGAVLFWMLNSFRNIKHVVINERKSSALL